MTLNEFFTQHPKVALAFSGGVDSSFLLWAARRYGADVQPYFVKGAFQPEFELADAKKLAAQVGADNLKILQADPLADATIAANPALRCYYCKKCTFGLIAAQATADGYTTIIDGTNASDDPADRPGVRALQEMQVLSPLALCGLTKDAIRARSKEAGLFTWDKPAYACLATRVPTGTTLTTELLERIEKAEGELFALGFTDFRVRVLADCTTAKIQLPEAQLPQLVAARQEILTRLSPFFKEIFLDLKVR